MPTDPPDEVLVTAATGGGQAGAEALAALVTRHRPLLLAVCRAALGDEGAEDAAQEAIVVAIGDLDRLRRPDRFGPWLAGIGRNVCRRRLRERLRDGWSWEAAQGGREHDWAAADRAAPGPGPAELAEAGEEAARVRAAVAGLPAGQREVVRLHYLAGLSQAETAERAGTSVGAVKVRLHKARQRLRARLGSWWKEEHMPAGSEQVDGWVEMRVRDVRRGPPGDGLPERYVVLLAEEGGDRLLPIWIGGFEGTALALLVAGTQLPRPGTHRLAAGVLAAAGGTVREVRVTRLEEGTFFAEVAVDGATAGAVVDARPSDAVALALETGAPILVAEAVLAAVAAEPAQAPGRGLDEAELPEGAGEIAAERQAEWERTMAALLELRAGRSQPPGPGG